MSAEKRWILPVSGDFEKINSLATDLGVDPTLAQLLVQRNIFTLEQAKFFFRPQLENLYNPFLMKDMQRAVNRINQAIANNEHIMVYGDYDVDGTTAVALVYSFIHKIHANISYYIPDRYDEGYGVSTKGINHAKENAVKLIISLDCGIKANEKINYANLLGIDFIICDHHLPGDDIPKAFAVLDAKQYDCEYPFKELSGCGVGFKLIQALGKENNIPFENIEKYLDLVAVSIAADIVPVVGENRILAFYGLKRLNENPRKGLHAIIKLSGLENHQITIDDIVFKIGPRINAAGRMEQGRSAVDLLIAEDSESAIEQAASINSVNNERKNIDRAITLEAIEMVKSTDENKKATVVYNPGWHKGVVGIVASRLIESFYRPTIVLTKSNGLISGSARSIPGFDLHQAVEACSDLLETFGGHTYAAGLTMKEENLGKFKSRFEKYVNDNIDESIMTPQVSIDACLDFKQITPKFFRILKQFQPFGPGNMSPVFLTQNVYDNGNSRKVGQFGEHIKLEIIQEDEPYRPFQGIAFNLSEHFDFIKGGNPIDICYSIAENYYRGVANIQLRVKDVKCKEIEFL
ncbi:MAG: single-stranded-DNA-specific exonuclease RecJ [Prevotellaceae bacterium]|jgi:single-stranded-DNA-specific exonuclease|nr:single-stranded-DNA-specific exonuclease RecJ [Prevotellaceae bacterium]